MLVKQKLKYIQSLGQKKFRQQERLFLAEGPKLVNEILQTDAAVINEVLALEDWVKENKKLLTRTTVTVISEKELERISQLTTPNKVLAVVRQFDDQPEITVQGKITLALDGIRDPGNLGTMIRTADWFGIDQIVCSMDSADVYNPKVVQATMGSLFRVRVIYRDLKPWLDASPGVAIYAATLDGEDISTVKKIREGIIILGNESRGISDEIVIRAGIRISIPGKGKAESLNAAVAAGIILSKLVT